MSEEEKARYSKYMQRYNLENKLRLWSTPGFSQFLNDLAIYMDNDEIPRFADVLKRQYRVALDELESEGKLKQGELEL